MDELLMKYIKGETTPEEREKVVRWLDEDPEHMHQYRSLRKLYDISLWSPIEETQQEEKQTRTFKPIWIEFLKVAAVILITFLGTKAFFDWKEDPVKMQTVIVPAGQRAELLLADGTKVWLNSRSKLKFPDRFQKDARKVELDGEGYFEVTHQEEAPFTVHTSKYDVKVLGTEFNVKAYKDKEQFETSLLKGSVEVSNANKSQTIRLKPDEQVVSDGGQLVRSTIQDKNYFRWKEGLLCLDDESIGSLIEKLELYYDVNIVVQRPSLMKYHYSGKFRIRDGVEHVLKVLQLKHRFTYTKEEEQNLIIIK